MNAKQTTIPRDAEKFVIRMPEDMRPRFAELAKNKSISMNTAMVNGLSEYLDGLEELSILIEGTRLLRSSLVEQKAALDAERVEIAELKARLEEKLGSGL